MGRLSKYVYEAGERYVVAGDLYNFVKWAKELRISTLDTNQLERTYAEYFHKNKREEALKTFQKYFGTVDPDVEFEVWRINLLKWVAYSMAFAVSVFLFLYHVSKDQ